MKKKEKFKIVHHPSFQNMIDYPDIQPKIIIEVPTEGSFYMTVVFDTERGEKKVESFGGTYKEIADWHYFNVQEINKKYDLNEQGNDCKFEDLIRGNKGFFGEPEEAVKWSDLYDDMEWDDSED